MPPKRHRAPRKPVVTTADKVRVVTRVRPLGKDEARGTAAAPELQVDAASNTVEGIVFDRVFDQRVPTQALFEGEVSSIVDSWLEGFNACVFAYGQTGSGKTHTMLGADGGKKSLDGLIPMTVEYALRRLEVEQAAAAKLDPTVASAHRVRVTYVELYNNEFRDLLKGYSTARDVPPLVGVESTSPIGVREDQHGRVFLDGASEFTIRSASDVLAVVKYGAMRRATDRTDMNAHSSRSHAILTLHHQHRWKAPSDGALKQSQSSLHLVDLAGSEYAKRTGNQGEKLKESIAINTGLFALGNVISALAGNNGRRVGDHIPYRDSLLTRVLQSALGGDSLTLMIVCCSPAPDDVAESLGSLRYAECARRIQGEAQLHVEDFVPEPSPMDGDLADPDETLNRRCLWLEVPGYGDVYSRIVGSPDDGELILFVHGSGPTNSSTWWTSIMWDIYVRRLPRKPYFMVAIDCPGYGRSPGDRQTIRSEPGAFLSAVVASLGCKDALCLVGSSQGACAVFNALLEYPTLSRHVAVMDPVGHDVFRYKLIKQPALLVFDTEDDGHPVKVGRWMRDNLPVCTYFEFAASKEPYWHADHMGDEIIKLVEGPRRGVMRRAGGGLLQEAVSGAGAAMVRLAGGLVNWVDFKGYGEAAKPVASGLLQVPTIADLGLHLLASEDKDEDDLRFVDRQSTIISTESCDVEGAEWIPEVDPKTRRVFYTNNATLEVMWRLPRHGVVLEPAAPEGAAVAQPAPSVVLFEDEVAPVEEAKPLTEEQLAALEEHRITEESSSMDCMRCGELLTLKPKRFVECRHVVCELCFAMFSQWSSQCCVCYEPLASVAKKKEGTVPLEDTAMQLLVAKLTSDPRTSARADIVHAELQRRASMHQVVLDYGNTASGVSGSAYTVEAFCRVHKAIRAKSSGTVPMPSTIACVAFNINPDFPKAAIRVTAAPHVLQRTMALCFECEMTVTFQNGPPSMPPVVIPYKIRHEPLTNRRVVIYVGVSAAGEGDTKRRNAKPAPVVVDVENTMEVFITV